MPCDASDSHYNSEPAYSVADSSFFMIEKMNTAESRQRIISTLHTIQRAIPLPQR